MTRSEPRDVQLERRLVEEQEPDHYPKTGDTDVDGFADDAERFAGESPEVTVATE